MMNRNCTYHLLILSLMLFLATAVPPAALAGAASEVNAPPAVQTGWSAFLRGAYLHQFETDIDNGGSFSVDRFYVEGGPTFATADGKRLSFSLGYGFTGYQFSGNAGFGALRPWEDINAVRLSAAYRWQISGRWSGFIVPTVRFTGEKGAGFSDALTGGGFVGFGYRFSDRLMIGPGIGALTQLEDSTQVIPVLVIKWRITDTLSLNTGRGLGATLGPGLTLDWQPSPSWTISVGGRYERLRFRLDRDGKVPDGIGDDRAFPIFAGVAYHFTPLITFSIVGGVEFGGELRLEDEQGHEILEEDHDTAGFLGLSFNARF